MTKRILRRPSPAMIVAVVALGVALGGTGYAATAITGRDIKNGSIRSADIGRHQVKHADVARRAITSANVRDGTLRARDFKRGQLPVGPRGPVGAPGAPGAPGTGGSGPLTWRLRESNQVQPGGAAIVTAPCPAGDAVVGGGGGWVVVGPLYIASGKIGASGPSTGKFHHPATTSPADGWTVSGQNTSVVPAVLFSYALCSSSS